MLQLGDAPENFVDKKCKKKEGKVLMNGEESTGKQMKKNSFQGRLKLVIGRNKHA
jgi:hypothetical protein